MTVIIKLCFRLEMFGIIYLHAHFLLYSCGGAPIDKVFWIVAPVSRMCLCLDIGCIVLYLLQFIVELSL